MSAGAASSAELEGESEPSLSCCRLFWGLEGGSHGQLACLQLLVVLISEVDQPGHVEEEFGQVLQQQEDQPQAG